MSQTDQAAGTSSAGTGALASWHDGAAKQAIGEFVRRVCADGPDFVPVEERVAVFDNDGTLWCEKPMPIQLDFILRRLFAMAEAQPDLREKQPWRALGQKWEFFPSGELAVNLQGPYWDAGKCRELDKKNVKKNVRSFWKMIVRIGTEQRTSVIS